MTELAQDFLSAFARGERKLPLPASLTVTLNGADTTIALYAVLRLLPRKRVMLKGRFGETIVAVKLFVKNLSSERNIVRELAGYTVVSEARIATPALLGRFTSTCGNYEGLIYQFIDAANELAERWPYFDNEQKQLWLREVMYASLQLHCVGAYQQDIHLGNFLLKNEQLYLLDLSTIVVDEAPLSQQKCLFNLGQLIAQLDVREHELAESAICNYITHSGWIDSTPLRNRLHSAIRHAWQIRLRDYLRKAKRDCSLTHFQRSFHHLLAHRRGWEGADLQQLLTDPDHFMARGQLLKAGNTATVVKAEINGRPVVIKRYNIKNWRHAIGRSLRPTRAMHSWIYAHMLELIGIRSLIPVALFEQRIGPLHGTAYFVAEWIEAPDLLSHSSSSALDGDAAAALRTLLLQMQKCRLSHGDFKANNLLLERDDIAVIDLDAMRRHRSARQFARAFKKDIERLRRNWPQGSALQKQIESLTQEIIAAP